MRDVILIVEGGGRRDLDRAFRAAFDHLLDRPKSRVREANRHWSTVPGGDRDDAYALFIDQTIKHPGALVLLLVDSEASPHESRWSGSKWARRAKEGRVFFMVRCMEAWIVADSDGLERNHVGLKKGLLPKGPPESLSPEDVRRALEAATKSCGFGPYEKRHGPLLLASVDPEVVKDRCPSAKAFLDGLDALLR